ncbi:MAG: hypothetical protein WKG00_00450 [Polyangiaceae bacterium]
MPPRLGPIACAAPLYGEEGVAVAGSPFSGALLGLVFVVLAFARSLRARLLLAAAAMAILGCGHVLSLWSSIDGWTASGNPIAVLGALVLGRTGLSHEGAVSLPRSRGQSDYAALCFDLESESPIDWSFSSNSMGLM